MKKLQIIALSLLIIGACKNGEKKSDAFGNFEAVETIVSSETAGKLLSMEVKQGDQLEPGGLIAQIDTTEIILKKLQTEAQLVASETKIDKWFLFKLKNIISIKDELCQYNSLESLPVDLLAHSKINGFSDFQIARHIFKSGHAEIHNDLMKVRSFRKSVGIIPYIKQIDTLAAEYPAVGQHRRCRRDALYVGYHGQAQRSLPDA